MYFFKVMSHICNTFFTMTVQFMKIAGNVLFWYCMENIYHMVLSLLPHSAVVVKKFMAYRELVAFECFSSRIVSVPAPETSVKMRNFWTPRHSKHVMRIFHAIQKQCFKNTSNFKLYSHCKKCIANDGYYFDIQNV